MTRIYEANEYKDDEDYKHELYFRITPQEARDLCEAIKRDNSFAIKSENYDITVYIE